MKSRFKTVRVDKWCWDKYPPYEKEPNVALIKIFTLVYQTTDLSLDLSIQSVILSRFG